MRLAISPPAVASLLKRTDGWVTALQLVGLALGQKEAAEDSVAAIAQDDRYVLDYLMAEVLGSQPEAVRDFVRQTSILERLSAPLGDAVTGRDDSRQMLQRVESANLFLVPLDNRREWYRYHPLFAEVLRLTLEEQEEMELHRRAAAWLTSQGLDEAARHHTGALGHQPATVAGVGSAAANQGLIEPLSERELEVLRLVADGCSNAEIARKLFITIGTVKRHTNNIYGKLGAASRTQAVARARAIRLIG
jgi:LuxR family maltose regulon positive regulatory protein